MNIASFFASIGTALLAQVSSIGAALVTSFGVLLLGFTNDERVILINAKQYLHDKYNELKAADASEIDAIEGAATATLNKFCADEKAEMAKEVGAVITLFTSSAKSVAGIVKTAVAG